MAIPQIEPEAMAAAWAETPPALYVDVRTVAEFATGDHRGRSPTHEDARCTWHARVDCPTDVGLHRGEVARRQVVAIGEAGLDYHYDSSPRDAQAEGFRRHIAAARW